MSASNTDKFKKLTNNFSTTLSSSIVGAGDSSMSLASTTNLPTDTGAVFVIDRVNSSGTATPSVREYVVGTVSGSNVTNLVRGVGNSTAQAHSTGAVVEQVVDQTTINDIIAGILQDHDQQGRHKQLTDTNGNSVLGLTATTSAVNQFTLANSATGNDPIQQSTGSDTDIGQVNQTKGKGNWRVKGRADGWNDLSGFGTFTYSANNGGKEFVVTTPSDLSSFLTPGMRMRFDRNTVPPTQSIAFASASSQSASKSSPSGITFTGNFTGETWLYLQSYPSAQAALIGRDSAAGTASGWEFAINTSGQLLLLYRNGTGSTSFNTYQSLPLNRWVHVAAAATVATPTVAFYINGTSVAGTSTATAATTVVQAATNLALAKGNNSTGFLNGYLSEARVWSVAQTQANIQANMAISLTGSESNLVALFQGNGNFNDKTSNANNLTANNGAIATQAANPYNTTEYARIRAVTSTTVTLYTGDVGTIPNMTLNNPYYSTAQAPNGFPQVLNSKTLAEVIWCASMTNTATATGTLMNGATLTLTIPTGGQKIRVRAYTNALKPGAGTAVLDAYWGSVQIGRAQEESTSNGSSALLISAPIFVSSGLQTFTLNLWETSAGTVSFAGATIAPAIFVVEED